MELDALVMGLFGAIGASKALALGAGEAGAVVAGVIGAIGGGMLRDVILSLPISFLQVGTLYAVAAGVGCAARKVIAAGQAACLYSLMSPPRMRVRSTLWVSGSCAAAGCCPLLGWARSDAGGVQAAGVVFEEDQCVEPSTEHGVEVEEVRRDDALGLGGEELPPGRAITAWCRIDARVMQDPPDRRGRDVVVEAGQLAMNPPVTPSVVLLGEPQYERLGRGSCRWAVPCIDARSSPTYEPQNCGARRAE
ncbi:TRIC cation channel family protein [Lentzea sp. NPDC051208]|uniref:TRIC cation channel family protein n=1 Tax=Lentzea sp. NPDC051208 TaxID=3154642 RepID=UPI003419AFCA